MCQTATEKKETIKYIRMFAVEGVSLQKIQRERERKKRKERKREGEKEKE